MLAGMEEFLQRGINENIKMGIINKIRFSFVKCGLICHSSKGMKCHRGTWKLEKENNTKCGIL